MLTHTILAGKLGTSVIHCNFCGFPALGPDQTELAGVIRAAEQSISDLSPQKKAGGGCLRPRKIVDCRSISAADLNALHDAVAETISGRNDAYMTNRAAHMVVMAC